MRRTNQEKNGRGSSRRERAEVPRVGGSDSGLATLCKQLNEFSRRDRVSDALAANRFRAGEHALGAAHRVRAEQSGLTSRIADASGTPSTPASHSRPGMGDRKPRSPSRSPSARADSRETRQNVSERLARRTGAHPSCLQMLTRPRHVLATESGWRSCNRKSRSNSKVMRGTRSLARRKPSPPSTANA